MLVPGADMAARKKAAKKKAAKRKAAKRKAAPKKSATNTSLRGADYGPKRGRPTKRTNALVDEILERMANGQSLSTICRDDHMPNISTIIRWRSSDPDFRANYEVARQAQAHAYFEQLTDIADDCLPDTGFTSKAKLQMDARKWSLARMNRALYGDKADLNIGGQGDAPPVQTEQAVDLTSLTPEERKELQRIAQRTITGKE